MTLPPSPNRLRRSARILLLDAEQRVLLIRFVLPRRDGDYLFWATPGGEIEDGEDMRQAAARELDEELGLALPLTGPVHHASGTFEFKHETVDNVDAFYLAQYSGAEITLGGVDDEERSVLKETRWWTADEIDAATDPVYPPDLATVVRALRTSPPAAPSGLRPAPLRRRTRARPSSSRPGW